MSLLTTAVHDELLASTLQKGLYTLAACSVIGVAVYAGYRAAEPDKKQLSHHHRRPESNEQVGNEIRAVRCSTPATPPTSPSLPRQGLSSTVCVVCDTRDNSRSSFLLRRVTRYTKQKRIHALTISSCIPSCSHASESTSRVSCGDVQV